MQNILFYGNCQMPVLCRTLNLDKTKYNETVIECFDTSMSETEFNLHVTQSDIIIMTLIEDNYRDKQFLSTTYVVYHAHKNCKIIILNNFHFSFYYVDLKIVNTSGNPYHHKSLYDCCKNNNTIDFYINNYVNNKTLKTNDELESTVNKSLDELNNRYDLIMIHKQMSPDKLIYSVPISPFIENNYKKTLLFYTNNHPSKYLFHYVCEKILNILNVENTIDYKVDVLDHTRCILYACIQQAVSFDITKQTPRLNKQTNIRDIAESFYEMYNTTPIEL